MHNGVNINTVRKMQEDREHGHLIQELVITRFHKKAHEIKLSDVNALQDISVGFIKSLSVLRRSTKDSMRDIACIIIERHGVFGLIEIAYNLIMSGNPDDFLVLVKFIRQVHDLKPKPSTYKTFAKFVMEQIYATNNASLIASFVCEFYNDGIHEDKQFIWKVLHAFERFTCAGDNLTYAQNVLDTIHIDYVNAYAVSTKGKLSHLRTLAFVRLRQSMAFVESPKVLALL